MIKRKVLWVVLSLLLVVILVGMETNVTCRPCDYI